MVSAVRAVLEAAQADQLEPAAAEAEFVIAAELVIMLALLLVEVAQPSRIGARRGLVRVEMVEAEGALEVEDRAVAESAAQRTREARLLAADEEHFVAQVEDGAVRPVERLQAGIAVAEAVVPEAQSIGGAAERAADRDLAVEQPRRRPVAADLRAPHIIAGKAAAPRDDVRDLARQAGNVERGGIDDLDSGDVGGADLPQFGEDVGRFAREALAVDQHVAARLAQAAALGVGGFDREARHLAQHVQRIARREAGEIGGRIGARALRRGGIGSDRRWRLAGGRGGRRGWGGLGQRRRGRRQQGDKKRGTRTGRRHIQSLPLSPPSPAALSVVRYICSTRLASST
jgi:hypothetical protein